MFFRNKPDGLDKHQRYVLRLYKKHGGVVGTITYFNKYPPEGDNLEAIDISIYINGMNYRAMIPLTTFVSALANKL